MLKAAMLYAETIGAADTYFNDITNADDYSISDIEDDIDLQFDVKTLYQAACLQEFTDSPYFDEKDWDYSNRETYKGNKSYEEFLDMIKNNK